MSFQESNILEFWFNEILSSHCSLLTLAMVYTVIFIIDCLLIKIGFVNSFQLVCCQCIIQCIIRAGQKLTHNFDEYVFTLKPGGARYATHHSASLQNKLCQYDPKITIDKLKAC